MVSFLLNKYEDLQGKEFKYYSQPVPHQKDSTSCGWCVIANAYRYIQNAYQEQKRSVSKVFSLYKFLKYIGNLSVTYTVSFLQVEDYPYVFIWWVREKCISYISKNAITPNDPDSPPPPKADPSIKKKKKKTSKKGMPVHSPFYETAPKRTPKSSKMQGKSPLSKRSPKSPLSTRSSPKARKSPKAKRSFDFKDSSPITASQPAPAGPSHVVAEDVPIASSGQENVSQAP